MHDNQLGRETSPYLLQHADKPVAWRPWGPDALAESAAADKPILLSVGYAACHWCHVMAHESFEDPETAAVMNDLFVNIKVDREERPDLDAIYQSALALLGEHGGWPLTMFCTPDGQPFWGGTYFPPRPSFGRPGFRDVLATVAKVYRDEPERVQHNVGALGDALIRMAASQPGDPPDRSQIDDAARRLVGEIDPRFGGLGGAPKFPQVPLIKLLWRAHRRLGDDALADAVTLTLDRMAQGGIYDHLGGGFARYSVDAQWLVPHFEKMLYDNAQLVELYAEVWRTTESPLYAQRVEETVDWLRREMLADGDSFAATIDADSEGEEGKYTVWSAGEIDEALAAAGLADDAAAFKAAYDVGPLGNWEGHTILNRSAAPELGDTEHEARLARCRAALLAERSKRVPPGRDDKVLADWNGLMIAALAQAATTFARPDWLAAAATAFRFVVATMQRDGRLGHAWRAGRLTLPGTLDDHAEMARAALALHEATGDDAYLDHARDWVAVADRHYWDTADGGYFLSADDATDVIARPKSATDNATPAGNGTMVEVLARLSLLTGEAGYRDRAEATLTAFAGAMARHPLAFATLLNAAPLLTEALQVVVIGAQGNAATNQLIDCYYRLVSGSRTLQVIPYDQTLPAAHPAHAKAAVDGVCLPRPGLLAAADRPRGPGGGTGAAVTRRTIDTPVGRLRLTAADGALVEIAWDEADAEDDDPLLDAAAAQLADYFAGRRQDFDLPLALQGTDFQRRVWQALQTIPFGATWSYGELADAVGSHARAVGGACGANPLPIVIPCHRVTSDAGSGGFSGRGGLETKHRLLALEGVTLPF